MAATDNNAEKAEPAVQAKGGTRRGARAGTGAANKPVNGGQPFALATSVVGSYSVPEWLERLKTDFYQRRISGAYLSEIHDVAIKAAIKDQERSGLDIVSDGELRRDNDIDYFLARMPGVEIPQLAKSYYSDYYDAVVAHDIPDDAPPMGLVNDFLFTKELTDHPVKFSFTGPFSLSRKVRNEFYKDEADLVMRFALVLNREARELAAAGVRMLQIDEPFLAGYPEHVGLAVKAINAVFDGVDRQSTLRAVHVCYGNRYARPQWEGHYDFLFPAVLEADIDQLVLEFARKGYDDLRLFERYPTGSLALGLGVIDVKRPDVEPEDVVAERIRRALQVVSPDRLMVNPDCGLRHLPPDIARAKLRALTAGTEMVRKDVLG
jgi:5-methyltetrahydropteroyltriglutamate--homocysteine methyltransferase